MPQLRTTLVRVLPFVCLVACAPKEVAPPPPPPPKAPNEVIVHASDFAYTLPAEVPSGLTTFKLVNDGPNLHHMVIARLDSGKTADDAKVALTKKGPPPMWLVPVGGPNAADPKGESNATIDLAPGNYFVFCMVDIPARVPHIAKGMMAALKVTPSTGPAATAPVADIKITLSDYKFDMSAPLTAGKHVIEVTTAPGQPHEIEIIKLADGKTVKDFMGMMESMMSGKPLSGPPAASAVGGMAPAVAGGKAYFEVTLTPGKYLVICFLPDMKDQKEHFEHGMMQEFTIQ